jgi:hypothetical protein
MKDRLYRKLNIPVVFIPYNYGIKDPFLFKELKMSIVHINVELHKFFDSIGLRILEPRYFHSGPLHTYKLHIDIPVIDNQVTRLNWIFDGKDSEMIWYGLKEGRKPQLVKNNRNEDILSVENDDCVEIGRDHLTGPNLVNVGIVHSLIGGTDRRHCYSFFLQDKNTHKRLEWDEALSRFGDYIV